jgi:site-specific DNA recombinase
MTTKGVGYYRMSTDSQQESIPAQRAWAREAARKHGVRLAAEFEDPGVPGGEIEHRPGLQALLAYCEEQFRAGVPVETVLVWDPDRLSRADSLKTAAVLSTLKDGGVAELFTASDGRVDLDDVTHRVLYLLKQDMGRAGFCESLARNTLRGKAQAASRGTWPGGLPPFGYTLEARQLVPDPEQGPVVSFIFTAYASGKYSLSSLGRELERRGDRPYMERRRQERGLPTEGIHWSVRSLECILMNPVYLGHTVWNKRHAGKYARYLGGAVVKDASARGREQDRRRKGIRFLADVRNKAEDRVEVPNTHPALTDAATFAAAQTRLAANRMRTTPIRGGGPWVLSGLVHCAHCGSRLVGETNQCSTKPGAGKTLYYRCWKARKRRCAVLAGVRQETLVAAVVDEIKERFADGPALEALRAQVAQLADKGRAGIQKDRERLLVQLNDLKGKVAQGYANLALLPANLVPGVAAQVQKWERERDETSTALERLGTAAACHEDMTDKVEVALKQLRRLDKVIHKADPAEARAALSGVIKAVRVHFRPGGRAFELDAVEVEMADAVVNLFNTSSWPRTTGVAPPTRPACRAGHGPRW